MVKVVTKSSGGVSDHGVLSVDVPVKLSNAEYRAMRVEQGFESMGSALGDVYKRALERDEIKREVTVTLPGVVDDDDDMEENVCLNCSG